VYKFINDCVSWALPWRGHKQYMFVLRFAIITIDEVEMISIILQCSIDICLLIVCMDQK